MLTSSAVTPIAAAAATIARKNGSANRRECGVLSVMGGHSRCPTVRWHVVHDSSLSCDREEERTGSIEAVSSAWHLRHACSVTAWLRGVIRSGSGYPPTVK